MAVKLTDCEACGRRIVLAAFHPDLTRPGRSRRDRDRRKRRTTFVPLDPVPSRPDDEQAPYALSVGRTTCHLITAEWPLISSETRHTVHRQTCPGRQRPEGGEER